MRDGRFQGNSSHQDFVNFVVAWNGREFANCVVHSHRTLRDDGTTFRHYRWNSTAIAEVEELFFFIVIQAKFCFLSLVRSFYLLSFELPTPRRTPGPCREWGLGRWRKLEFWFNDEADRFGDACVENIRLGCAENQLCVLPIFSRALSEVHPVV